MTKRFELGETVATPGALEALRHSEENPAAFLFRHQSGDWGDVCSADAKANDEALLTDGRIFSVYETKHRVRLWIITEADRSATTILLPDEY